VFVGVLVGHQPAAPFLLGEMIDRGRLDQGVGQHVFERGARDRAAGEGAAERVRMIAAYRLDMRRPQCLAVERPHRDRRLAVAAAIPLLPEGQVASGIKLEVVAHALPVALDEADQAAVMVAVRMAQDQAVELLRLDPEQVEIAVHDLRGEAEIEQILVLLAGSCRLEVQREAPFAGQGRSLTAGYAGDVLDPAVRMARLRHEQVEV
jgi:hypothetical protein